MRKKLNGIKLKNLTVNQLFSAYIGTKNIAETTRVNYLRIWDLYINESVGVMKVTQIAPLNIKSLYNEMAKRNFKGSTIKLVHNLLNPVFEMAIDNDLIMKNPCKKCLREFIGSKTERKALTLPEQTAFLKFAKTHPIYSSYYPLLIFMLGTALRIGELSGLTWADINLEEKRIYISHQLIYKNLGNGCQFYLRPPKTNNGFRTIPMTAQVIESLNLQKMKQLDKGIKDDVSVCGHKGFVFTAKTGKPFAPNGFNAILMNIINAYNRQEDTAPLPPISGHTLRHTACTRMAESGIDPKVLQIIMGHGDIGTTMNIYNHCDILRLELEMRKYEGGICEA